jgi:hypothetical protein
MKKANTTFEELTKGYPKEFLYFLTYSRKLKFEEKPDYQHLISMFRELFVRESFELDFVYNWILRKQSLKGGKGVFGTNGPARNFAQQQEK